MAYRNPTDGGQTDSFTDCSCADKPRSAAKKSDTGEGGSFMKAAIYCRLSEEDRNRGDADSLSIQNQKSMLVSYAVAQDWEVYAIYSDDDYAGADRRRPAFNKLLRDAEARLFDIVLCKTQSRFTREMELVEKYIHGLFPLWGIRFVSIVDNADTAAPGNKKARQISGLVNEWYLEDMSENIRAVLTDRRRKGFHIGAHALYGYKKDPDKRGHLLPDPSSSAVVREIFTLYASGYGKTAIARILNARRIATPSDYRTGRSGSLWQYGTIGGILSNEMYIGNMVQGRYGSVSYKTKQNRPRDRSEWIRVEGTHEPIVGRELWDAVQTLRTHRARPFSGGAMGVLSGLVHCGSCGARMRTVKNRDRRYFQCRNRYLAPDRCSGAFASAALLETAVLRELSVCTDSFAEILTEDALASCLIAESAADFTKELHTLAGEMAQYKRALSTLYLDKVRGIVTESEYIEMAESMRAAREQCQKRYTELTAQSTAPSPLPSAAERIAAYLHPTVLTREIALAMVKSIAVWHRTDDGTIPVEIQWRF